MPINHRDIPNWVHRFDISDTEATRIAATVETEEEFERVWEDEDWWTDEKNPTDSLVFDYGSDPTDEPRVRDRQGGVWWPGDEATAEIAASDNPAETALRMCTEENHRGEWRA